MFQSPPKGATIPYRPKPPVGGPVILAGGQAYTIQGNYAVPAHTDVSNSIPRPPLFAPQPPLPVAPLAAIAPHQLVSLDKHGGHLQAALPPPTAHLIPSDVS